MITPTYRRLRIRGLIKVNSGAAGIAVGITEGEWVRERIRAARRAEEEEDIAILLWGASRRMAEAKTLNAALFIDTDPASQIRFEKEKRVFDSLKIPATWVKIPGPTAGQDPEALDRRLRSDEEAVKPVIDALERIRNTVDLEHVQSIQFNNSMHGSGMAINSYIAEVLASRVLKGNHYKLMLAINADITRIPSKLDYLKSTKWSLNRLRDLLAKESLDAVMIIDNTLASAVKSVWLGLSEKEKLTEAWKKLLKTEDTSEAIARFYSIIARIAKLDPHEVNDLIVQAAAPLTIVPSWGMLIEGAMREIRASSGPWDYFNIKRVTEKSYIIPGYLPSEQLQRIDFRAISRELALATLAPLDSATVNNVVIVLGERDRKLWESQGISMYELLERSFMQLGYYGPLDILTIPEEGGIWIYAVVSDVKLLEIKFGARPEEEAS